MKIKRLTAHWLEAPLTEPFGYSRAWFDKRTALLVEIESADGTCGWGECYGPAAAIHGVVGAMADLVVGEDALATELIWQKVYSLFRDHGQRGLAIQALSGIDNALWDLKGKLLGQPAHRLMGGPLRLEVRAYATGLYRRKDGDPTKYLAEEAAGYRDEGFCATKLKVGYGIAEDIANVRAVREAIGPDMGLMIDANHAYDFVSALKLSRAVAELDIGWFEEPVIPEDIEGYRELRRQQPIPIAGGECSFTRFDFKTLLTSRAVDIVQPDTCAAGGISECKKIADMAAAFGVRYAPHVWGTGIGIAASLQLLAVLPHNPLSLSPQEPIMEFDRTEHPIRMAVLKEPIEHRDGKVAVPQGPGLGIEIERSAVERMKVA